MSSMTRAYLSCLLLALLEQHICHADELKPRQASGVTDASFFLRRGYHASIVAGDFIYIDGGEFSTYNDGEVNYEYSNTLLAIDLTKSWTNSTVTLHSTPKPASVPSLVHPGLWHDPRTDTIYTGLAGLISTFNTTNALAPPPMGIWTFAPDGLGSGTWGTALETAGNNNNNNNNNNNITRPYTAAVAHSGATGIGYALGGSITAHTAPGAVGDDAAAIVNVGGMLRFDMATRQLTNVTVEGPRFGEDGRVQYAEMVYVPNFGAEGVFVVLGGVTRNPETDALDWVVVTVFEPSEERWFDQETTGEAPTGRKEFCAAGVASENGTYEIFVYAGWGGDLGTKSVQYDQIYILTLPAFHWIKVDYSPTGTRHALTCHAVGGSQILTIGGVNSASTDSSANIYQGPFRDKDKYTQGLAVFDLTALEWKSEYTANASKYTQSELVRRYYAENSRTPTFNSTQLKAVFDTTNFTSTDSTNEAGSNVLPSASPSTEEDTSKSLSAGAIAGISVGAVIAVLLLSGASVFYFRSKRQRRRKETIEQQYHPWNIYAPAQEMPSEGVAELPPDETRRMWELQGGPRDMSHEKDGNAVVAELAGEDMERRRINRSSNRP